MLTSNAPVLFSNESRFKLSFDDGLQRIWLQDSKRFLQNVGKRADSSGGGFVIARAGISTNHRIDTCFH